MATYLVERTMPGLTRTQLSSMHEALSEASRRLNASGSFVRYLRSTYVPARSRCLSLFEAPSMESIRNVNEVAQVPFTAIDEVLEIGSPSVVAPTSGNQ